MIRVHSLPPWPALRALASILTFLLFTLAAPARAQEPIDPDEALEAAQGTTKALSAEERAQLLELLDRAPPAPQRGGGGGGGGGGARRNGSGGSPAGMGPLRRHYSQQYLAALKLQLPEARVEAVLRNWVTALPDDGRALWELASLHIRGPDRDGGVREARAAIEMAPSPEFGVMYRAQLAMNLASDGEFEAGEQLLGEADALVRAQFAKPSDDPRITYRRLRAINRWQAARCTLDGQLMRYEQAIPNCRLAASGAAELVKRSVALDERGAWHAMNTHLSNQLRLVDELIFAQRLFEAERELQATGLLYDSYGRVRAPEWALRRARVRLAQGRHDEAVELARRAQAQLQQQGLVGASADQLRALRLMQDARALQGRWPEALALFDEADVLAAGQTAATHRAEGLRTRTLAYLRGGRAAALEPRLREAVEQAVRRAGDDSFLAASQRALLGLVLAAQADPARIAAGRELLQRALPQLLVPRGLGDGREDSGIGRLVREAALQRYLDLLGETPDATGLSLGLQVADALRASSVQQALNQAAARSAAQTAGLADIVRRDQDARNELQTLYGLVAREAAEDAPRRLDRVLGQLKRRIAELEQQRAGLQAEITRQFPEYGQLVNPAPPGTAEIARLLAPDEAFVALLPVEGHVHVWVVTPAGAAYRRAPLTAPALQVLVQRLRATLDVAASGSRLPAFDLAAARELHETLLAPLAPQLAAARHLVFAPGGVLGQLPMGVLVTGAPTAEGTPWLLRRAAISHVASASAWVTLRRVAARRAAPEAFAGWGDPRFASAAKEKARPVPGARQLALPRGAGLQYGRIPPLPDTRDELLAIAGALRADPAADTFLGERATRQSVLQASRSGWLARKRVLVFATHGLMAGDLPELAQPALALANDGSGDTDPLAPLLTLEDVLGLKLNADWVVLSACNTAANDGSSQEALSGLARGFFYAGSRSLLVTHWSVESESATQLTTRTFAHQRDQPQARKAESLRQAMLQVMALPRYGHPAFWAPYALVGDGGR